MKKAARRRQLAMTAIRAKAKWWCGVSNSLGRIARFTLTLKARNEKLADDSTKAQDDLAAFDRSYDK